MEVLRYKSIEGQGPLIAFISFRIPEWGLNLADCRLLRTKKGGLFIGFPGKKYESEGETKYAPYFWFDKDLTDRFQKSAKSAIDDYVKSTQVVQDVSPVIANEPPPF